MVKLNLALRDILSYLLIEIDSLPMTLQPGFVEFRFKKGTLDSLTTTKTKIKCRAKVNECICLCGHCPWLYRWLGVAPKSQSFLFYNGYPVLCNMLMK